MNNIHFLFQSTCSSTFSNPENFCKVLLLLRRKKEVICEEIFPKSYKISLLMIVYWSSKILFSNVNDAF